MLLGLLAVGGGIAVLGRSADQMILGASRLALLFRLAPVVVGAVIIGFGTSAPEMLVSAIAAASGDPDVGIGNIVGSNVANLSLILGLAGCAVPVAIKSGVLRREAPLSLVAVLAFGLVLATGMSVLKGVALLATLAASLVWILRGDSSPEFAAEVEDVTDAADHSKMAELTRTLVALVFTVASAWVLVWGALRVADEFGLSGGFIGVTLVALGTSLPELVAALAAARAGQTELIVGNLLGSNLFNSLAVGGLVALLSGATTIDSALAGVENYIMMGVAVLAYVMMHTRGVFQRVEGAFLVVVFFGFILVTYLTEAA